METSRDAESRIAVLGIGNILLKDEGVGVRVVEELRRSHTLPPGVDLVDGGTAGLDLLDLMDGASQVVVVDCVLAGGEPGTIFRIPLDQIQRPSGIPQSLHQVGILEALAALDLLGRRPDAVLVGVQPREIALGLDLSPEVEARLPDAVRAVLQELRRLGIQPLPRTTPTL